MKTIATFCNYHLGDNLVHLHFLRALAKAHPEIFFTHTAAANHIAQLRPVVADLPNLSLTGDFLQLPQGAINAWRGTEGHWYHAPDRNDFAAYHLRWFGHLAERMGLLSPFKRPADLLFDYPALQQTADGGGQTADQASYDFLIVNSPPMSGQWSGFSLEAFDRLCTLLDEAGHTCITTHPSTAEDTPCTQARHLDVTAIGRLSQRVKCIIGCVTGPMWPTLNTWNAAKPLRIHLLDSEHVELCANTIHANSLSLVPEILKDRGLL